MSFLEAPVHERFRGALLGLAAGDAVGTTLEFRPPGSFDPIIDLVGGGPFGLKPGEWTDDTSMALCLAESLVECQGFDPVDQLKRYVRWWHDGYLSSNGRCFDIGGTVRTALSTFERTGAPDAGPTDEWSAGNGSLMRLAPIALAYAQRPTDAIYMAAASSRTTHGALEAVDACRIFAGLIVAAVRGATRDELITPIVQATESPTDPDMNGGALEGIPLHTEFMAYWYEWPVVPTVAAVAAGSYLHKEPPKIRGLGHVVRSLEAAMWALSRGDTFRDVVLLAANLGDDADTTAAIAGQLAGACWGLGGDRGVPEEWVAKLALRERIEELADGLYKFALER